MDPSRFRSLQRAFLEVWNLDVEARRAALDELRESDRTLAEDVEALLRAHEGRADFLESDALNEFGVPEVLDPAAEAIPEKLGRFKLNDSLLTYSNLNRVLELETLTAAAQERIALWDNLGSVAGDDSRLEGITFSFFREQSEQHLFELNSRRRFAAMEAFRGD